MWVSPWSWQLRLLAPVRPDSWWNQEVRSLLPLTYLASLAPGGGCCARRETRPTWLTGGGRPASTCVRGGSKVSRTWPRQGSPTDSSIQQAGHGRRVLERHARQRRYCTRRTSHLGQLRQSCTNGRMRDRRD